MFNSHGYPGTFKNVYAPQNVQLQLLPQSTNILKKLKGTFKLFSSQLRGTLCYTLDFFQTHITRVIYSEFLVKVYSGEFKAPGQEFYISEKVTQYKIREFPTEVDSARLEDKNDGVGTGWPVSEQLPELISSSLDKN